MFFVRPAGRIEIVGDVAHGGINGVRAAEREIDMAQRSRRQFDQFGGQADRRLRAKMEITRRIGQLGHLLGGGTYDAIVAIADIHTPQA